MTLFMLL